MCEISVYFSVPHFRLVSLTSCALATALFICNSFTVEHIIIMYNVVFLLSTWQTLLRRWSLQLQRKSQTVRGTVENILTPEESTTYLVFYGIPPLNRNEILKW